MALKGLKQDLIAALGEFVGTTMFLFLGLGCVKTAQDTASVSQMDTVTTLNTDTIMFISAGMGFSLLITVWAFYRVSGGLFNPAVTLSLFLIGGLTATRAILLLIAQIVGGIAGAALVAGLTPMGGIEKAVTTLQPGMNHAMGCFLEAFMTAMLCFVVLMLAAEKHRATFLAPVGVGITLFVGQLLGTVWTGCGMNPARAFAPSVVSGQFPGYHWIYWVGPLIGAFLATGLYTLLKHVDYGTVVLGQDSDDVNQSPAVSGLWLASMGFTREQRKAMLASGMRPDQLDRAESGMVATMANLASTDQQGKPIIPPVVTEVKAPGVKAL